MKEEIIRKIKESRERFEKTKGLYNRPISSDRTIPDKRRKNKNNDLDKP